MKKWIKVGALCEARGAQKVSRDGKIYEVERIQQSSKADIYVVPYVPYVHDAYGFWISSKNLMRTDKVRRMEKERYQCRCWVVFGEEMTILDNAMRAISYRQFSEEVIKYLTDAGWVQLKGKDFFRMWSHDNVAGGAPCEEPNAVRAQLVMDRNRLYGEDK